jgi:hypothetical protein
MIIIFETMKENIKNKQRKGQALMNAISEHDKYLYNQIKGTELDVFYSNDKDDKIDKLIEIVLNKYL